MFKFVVLVSMVFAAANAGLIASPIALHAPVVPVAHIAPVAHVAHVAPVAHVAHVAPVAIKAHVPVATSYQSQVQISHGSVPVVAAAPIIKASPVLAVGHHLVH